MKFCPVAVLLPFSLLDLPWYQLSLIRCCGEGQPGGRDSVQVPAAQTFESHANTLVLPSSILHLKSRKERIRASSGFNALQV